MARPQKFRHSREALNDPEIALKLGGFVLDIEALRKTKEQIDMQIAAAYDAVDDAGFEKKYVRKSISLRAKETTDRQDEEYALEAYELAIEKGVSLTRARRKRPADKIREGLEEALAVARGEAEPYRIHTFDPETGEIIEHQPETATQSERDEPVGAAVTPNAVAGTVSPSGNPPAGSGSDAIPAPHSEPVQEVHEFTTARKPDGEARPQTTGDMDRDIPVGDPEEPHRLNDGSDAHTAGALADQLRAPAPLNSNSVALPPPSETDTAAGVQPPASAAAPFEPSSLAFLRDERNERCQRLKKDCKHARNSHKTTCSTCGTAWQIAQRKKSAVPA